MAERHVFQRATVTRIIKETADTRTFVLDPHEKPFTYRAGQFCTFKVTVDGEELYRSYSMSSAPETDTELMTTVKRVAGGKVSNWLVDNVVEGDELTMTRAAGTFVLSPTSAPLLAFAGGSGVTPILSLAKSALASTDRAVRILCADRDRASVIFEAVIDELVGALPRPAVGGSAYRRRARAVGSGRRRRSSSAPIPTPNATCAARKASWPWCAPRCRTGRESSSRTSTLHRR